MSGIRHSTFDAEPRALAQQCSEFARDAQAELDRRPVFVPLTVEDYTATGSTSTRIRIGAATRPWSVTLARIAKTYGQDEPVVCTPVLNFVWDSTTQSIDVFEPDGLTANTVYRLQFLVMEAP